MLVHLSTHFLKYFNLFSIFLLYWYIFTFFDNFLYIFCLFLKENGKGKGRAAAGGTCNEPCQHPPKALAGFRRMTAVAV